MKICLYFSLLVLTAFYYVVDSYSLNNMLTEKYLHRSRVSDDSNIALRGPLLGGMVRPNLLASYALRGHSNPTMGNELPCDSDEDEHGETQQQPPIATAVPVVDPNWKPMRKWGRPSWKWYGF